MSANGVGAVVVADPDDGRVVGIVSERDLVTRVMADEADPKSIPVDQIMTPDPASCDAGASVSEVQEVMASRGIRHLPVLDEEGQLVRMVSSRDVMAYQVMSDRAMRGAAEQVAMLSTNLKSLDFDEVIAMVTSNVPSIFQARRGVVFFPSPAGDPQTAPLVSRQKCPCPETLLGDRADAQQAIETGRIQCQGSPCRACTKLGAEGVCITIPLTAFGARNEIGAEEPSTQGFLCMCCLDQAGTFLPDLIWYKGSLVRGILNSNLTHAMLYQEARRESLTDAQTLAGTRRLFEEKFTAELGRSNRYEHTFCVAMLDIDGFMTVNDEDHPTRGDAALRTFVDCVNQVKRSSDVLARYGGDEFVLLMPETDRAGAVAVLERVRSRTEQTPLVDGIVLTVSCGVAEYDPRSAMPGNKLIRCADRALHEAKKAGRNCVKTWWQVSQSLDSQPSLQRDKVEDLQRRLEDISMRSKEIFIQSIRGLIQALEARDSYTRCHSENVMRYAVGIADAMGVDAPSIAVIRRAAMIHDIGKIGVPDQILRKPGRLTEEERTVMQQHPLIGVQILDRMRFLERELPIVRHHHEWYDGGGYPDGISEARIPPGGRILGVADAFDAITSDRVYRKSRPISLALEILTQGSGSQFDPGAVEAMLRWIDQVGQADPAGGAITTGALLTSQDACIDAA